MNQGNSKKSHGGKLTDLQKTQVLNLQRFEEVARFEKRTSKKPAAIVALFGILFIAFGFSFQIKQTLDSRKPKVEKRDISKEVVVPEKKETALKCMKSMLGNTDGTDLVYTIDYHFLDEKLSAFSKVLTIMITANSPVGEVTVQNYLRDYQPFLNPTDGYQISVEPIQKGLITTVNVDFEKLDLLKLNPKQQEHFSTKIDFPIDTDLTTIQQAMLKESFICQ